jgi:ribosome-associated heat shock protein Hsp15
MRLDLLLFRLRLTKSRAIAQARIAEGHMRVNGQRVAARDKQVQVGDVLTLPTASGVLVIALDALPDRRGPPAEARQCYRVLDAGGAIAIAGQERGTVPVSAPPRIEGKSLT